MIKEWSDLYVEKNWQMGFKEYFMVCILLAYWRYMSLCCICLQLFRTLKERAFKWINIVVVTAE